MFHVGSDVIRPLIFIAFWAMVSFALAVIGPFDTYQLLTFGSRLAYWALIVALSVGLDAYVRLKYPVEKISQQVFRRFCYVVVLSICLFGINATVFDGWGGTDSFILGFSYVLIISIGIELIIAIVLAKISEVRAQETATVLVEAETLPALQGLLAKLPREKRGEVWHLEARGHYLGVSTEHGDEDVLMRFSDAVLGLPDALGFQTHRSHWVARSAVRTLIEREGKPFVQLVDDRLVPVSKARLEAVKYALMQS